MRTSHEQDWLRESVDVELLEQAEQMRATITSLEAEVQRLQAALGAVRGDDPSLWLDTSPVSAAEPVRGWAQPRQQNDELAPIVWSRLPLLAAALLGGWVMLGGLVYLVLQLAS
jgi:hypothetical protein